MMIGNAEFAAFGIAMFLSGSLFGAWLAGRSLAKEFQKERERMKENSVLPNRESQSEDMDFDIHDIMLKDYCYPDREEDDEEDIPPSEHPFPVFITESQLESEFPESEYEEVEFYRNEGILVDERGEEVGDLDRILGPDNLKMLRRWGTETAIIHNYEYDTNYQIFIRDDSYEKED